MLEQYPTSAHIAAVILFTAQNTYGGKICPHLVLQFQLRAVPLYMRTHRI